MRKRVFAFVTAAIFALSLAACTGAPASSSAPVSQGEAASSTSSRAESAAVSSSSSQGEKTEPKPSESSTAPESSLEPEQSSEKAPAGSASSGESSSEQPAPEEPSAGPAVVYFSATGTTAGVAKLIAEETGGELFEIVPAEPYTAEDLAYTNDSCRANQEMNDDSARPAISGDLSAVSGHEVVYLGYPIWWGTAPRIIQTFLDTGSLDGRTVYLFCTSGGSGVEPSVRDLQGLYPNVNIVSGKRLNNAGQADVQQWINSLND